MRVADHVFQHDDAVAVVGKHLQRQCCVAQASARALGWTAFVPLPEALLADVDLIEGRLDAASTANEHAHGLALQLGDPCWEGVAARGLGLIAASQGDAATVLHWITEAHHRCVRLPDAYLWVEGYCLDALCAHGLGVPAPYRRRCDRGTRVGVAGAGHVRHGVRHNGLASTRTPRALERCRFGEAGGSAAGRPGRSRQRQAAGAGGAA
jgi:hypothetical protein